MLKAEGDFIIIFINKLASDCYLQKGEGDEDDIWRIELEGGTKGEIIEIVRHSFRLVHNSFKCVLVTTEKNYPEWGFGQTEVACNPKYFDNRAVWHIDDNIHPRRKKMF